jgi:hypothetical protein
VANENELVVAVAVCMCVCVVACGKHTSVRAAEHASVQRSK